MGDGPKRVLHVLGAMNRGGAETWLMNVLRRVDRKRYAIDFLVHSREPAVFDNEIRALGAEIHYGGDPRHLWSYSRSFSRVLREHGPYDIVHSHVHHFSGVTLALARREGVPHRIAHSHNDTRVIESRDPLFRSLYRRAMEALIRKNATAGLACSTPAAEALYGEQWQQDGRWRVLFCGIDLEPFREMPDTSSAREELGIPEDAFVMGHVGRFEFQKNHELLLNVAGEVIRRRQDAWLLLVGDGPLREEIARRADELGISSRVVFAGLRSDVPRIMTQAMDVFVFPSRFEGLGLALVEAQAANLPCVFSDVIPAEVDRVDYLVNRLPLAAPATEWAEAVLESAHGQAASCRADALGILENSPLAIGKSVNSLEHIYAM